MDKELLRIESYITLMATKEISKSEGTNEVSKCQNNINSNTIESTKSTSWSGLWNRYKNIWRQEKDTNYKQMLSLFSIVYLIPLVLSGSLPLAIYFGPMLGVYYVALESYLNKMSKFVGTHMGILAGIPVALVSFIGAITTFSLSGILLALFSSIMFLTLIPLLYYIYSDIGHMIREEQDSDDGVNFTL